MIYRAYGRSIESDHPLPELEPATSAKADLRIIWNARLDLPADATWSTLWRFSDGEPWVTVGRTSAARYLRFGRLADFRMSEQAIEIASRGHVRDATLRHLLLDQALPVALAGGGALVLHASAVCIGGHAVLFMGEAGAGKSTLAAFLGRDGSPVLADDGVLIEETGTEIRAVPSYPGLRLFPDAVAGTAIEEAGVEVAEYSRKRRILAAADSKLFHGVPAPVGLVYELSPGGACAFERLSRRDATVAMLKHAYRADVEGAAQLESQLDRVAHSSSALEIWRLTYPRDWASAPAVARAVAAHAATYHLGALRPHGVDYRRWLAK